ncbi:Transcriptional coactivator/pterin dehydratase [Macleaya cordata]|uniref:4a-hydroxytetrahydrobiopterin dehydratase n=1 Tax=Macleaya cordata TaxID=56857 RepID=A0A200Q8U8_MACCD|nr:Transcriptional coactivator/pterin dehydratase [Macleaya cordata]
MLLCFSAYFPLPTPNPKHQTTPPYCCPLQFNPTHNIPESSSSSSYNSTGRGRRNFLHQQKTSALGSDMLGDFGARDPYPAEIESGFGEKVLGAGNTEHRILIPNISALSLSQQQCSPVSPSEPPLIHQDAQQLLRKVVGWRLVDDAGGLRLQCLWKLRDFKCGIELINRIFNVAEAAGHYPNLHLEQPNQVRAELWTASIGGLSMNDFILAAKIDEIKTSDLVPKKRIWA